MSTPKVIAILLTLAATPALAQGYGFGKPASAAEIRGWDIDVRADGQGLPPGSGNATEGKVVYEQKCAACHGLKGEGSKIGERLAGGQGTLKNPAPVKSIGSFWPYATTIFDYTRRAMPLNNPQTLTNDEVYALTAYILKLNGIIGAKDVMNAKSLPKVKMPNRDGFMQIWPGNIGPNKPLG